jgi:PAS domain S-box-containing protein
MDRARILVVEDESNSVADPIWLMHVEPDGGYRCLAVSLAALTAKGPSEEHFVGKRLEEIYAEPVLTSLLAKYEQAVQTRQPIRDEVLADSPAGRRTFESTIVPVIDEAGACTHLLMVNRDVTERKRAEEAEREQRDFAEALRDTTAALNGTLDFNEVLDRILANVERVVPHDAAAILLIDPPNDTVYLARYHDRIDPAREAAVRDVRLSLNEAANLRQMMTHSQPLIIPDTSTYPGWVDLPATRWKLSQIGAPIRAKERVIGFLNLDSATPGFFTATHAERLQTFADQAAIAIENARLFDAERTAREQAETLRQATQALSATLNLQQVFDRILGELQKVVPYDSASVQQLKGDWLTVIGGRGFPNLEEIVGLSFDLTSSDNPNRQVVRTRASLILEDVTAVYRNFQNGPHAEANIRSWLGVPLLFGDQLIGMIALDKREPAFYDEQHARLALAFAAQAAIAIQNAQLFETAQQRLAEQTALLAASTAVSSSLDLEAVLNRLAEQMVQAIDATSGYICDWEPATGIATLLAEAMGPDALPQEKVSELGVTYHLVEDFGDDLDEWLLVDRPLITQVDDPDLYEPSRAHLLKYGGHSALTIPLVVKGKSIGYVDLWESRRRREFTPQEIALCQGIARQAAIAIENARLYAEVRRYATELERRVVKRTEELERERNRLQAILDAAGEGITLTDRNWVIEYVNPAIERISGYSLAEALGHSPRLWASNLTPLAVYENMQHALDRGEVWQGEVIHKRKDGSLYDASLTIAPLKDETGDIVGQISMQHDITHLKELDRLKDQFVTRIGHELRTPVASVLLTLDLLERGKPDKREQYLRTLRGEAIRLRKLVEGFLELAELDASDNLFRLDPLNLNQLATDVIARTMHGVAERTLSLDYQADRSLLPILSDTLWMSRVLSILLDNALNYTPRGGHILCATSVRHAHDQVWVTFSVQNTGPGIPPEDMPRLFERFYRGRAADNYSTSGAGLGLAICKAVIEKMGGHITVESQPQEGATFTVWLKAANPAA